jgi:hypothetical protein
VSYDLVFSRQHGPATDSPQSIYSELLEGRRVNGLVELDTESFIDGVLDAFPGAARGPQGDAEWIEWSAPDRNASFQVEWSTQHVVAFCRGATNDVMNRLIDIAVTHGCRLYDPQVNERFG